MPALDSKRQKGRQRRLLPSSLEALDATSKVPFPVREREVQQHKRDEDVTSDICLSCSCCLWAGAEPKLSPV